MGVRRYRTYWEYLIILLSLLSLQWKGRNCEEKTEALPGFKIKAPAEVTVQRGLCVLIPCNFIVHRNFTVSKDAIGIWYKGYPSDAVAASTNSSQFPNTTNGRFIFTGNVSAGDCSFSISDAQPGDAAKYRFRLEDRSPLKFNFLHIQPSVSVTDLKEPEISPTKDLIAGEEVTVTCTAPTNPPTNCPGLYPNFTWEGSVNTKNTQNNTLRNQDGTISYWSNITFTPSPRHHNSSLTCTVTYKLGSAKKSITLNVKYTPILNITLPGGTGESSRMIIKEGDSQEIYCKVDSNPMADIIWTRGKIPVENIQRQNGQNVTLSLRNVTENDSDTYTCTAQNQRGNNSRSISVSVEYAPRQSTICVDKLKGCLTSVNVLEGSTLSLNCSANSNPPANFSWIQRDPLKTLSENTTLNVTVTDDIEYTCQAGNKHGLSNSSITINVTYAPRQPMICVDNPEGCLTSVNVLEGSTLSLNCSAKSKPPANFSWIQSDPLKKLSENTTLNVTVTDDIEYTCQAENKHGLSNSSIIIIVTRAQKPPTNFLIAGLCILFLMLVVMTALFVFRWMRKKKDLPEDRINKEMPKSDVDVIYNNIGNIQSISNESYMDTEKAKQKKDDSDLYMNYEKEVQYVSLDFSKMKPKEAPQTDNIVYSEVKRN